MKKLLIVLILIAILGAGYWYSDRAGWFTSTAPDNLPTKDDWVRMDAVEESSSQIAPDAKPGIQVREKGSTPPPPPPTPQATSSEEGISSDEPTE